MFRIIMILLLLLTIGCQAPVQQDVVSVFFEEEGRIEKIFFCPRDDCAGELESFIQSATESVHCAFFDLDLTGVISALEKKKTLGLDVQVIVDGDYYEELKHLSFIKGENRSSFMHNKFCIIDNTGVSTGSFNPTFNGAHKNNNNLIILRSNILAQGYETEFKELNQGLFGKGDKSILPLLSLNGSKVEVYFCPEDDCGAKIKGVLKNAEKNIYFLTFSFTHTGIANSIVMKIHEDVDVKGVFEKRGAGSEYSRYDLFDYQGADVRKDNNSGIMHHKVFIIDNSTVITGSFNPSKNADTRNDENVIIIHDEDVAEMYLEEFEYIWDNYT